jgi:Trypsin
MHVNCSARSEAADAVNESRRWSEMRADRGFPSILCLPSTRVRLETGKTRLKLVLASPLGLLRWHKQRGLVMLCLSTSEDVMLTRILIVLSVTSSCLAINSTATRVKRQSHVVCGVPSQSTSLVIRGNDFQRGTWPWMVALMRKTESPPKLFCGGVLVTTTKVLTGESAAKTPMSSRNCKTFFSQRRIASKTKTKTYENGHATFL